MLHEADCDISVRRFRDEVSDCDTHCPRAAGRVRLWYGDICATSQAAGQSVCACSGILWNDIELSVKVTALAGNTRTT